MFNGILFLYQRMFAIINDQGVGQSLDGCHADEGCCLEIRYKDFVLTLLHEALHKVERFFTDCFNFSKSADAGNLLFEDAVQLGIDAMRGEHGANKVTHGVDEFVMDAMLHRFFKQVEDFTIVPCNKGCDQGLFVGKILIERSDTHTRHCGNAICTGARIPFFGQNASSGVKNGLDSDA